MKIRTPDAWEGRSVTKFLFFPMTLRSSDNTHSYTRWLEFAVYYEEYNPWVSMWEPKTWIDL